MLTISLSLPFVGFRRTSSPRPNPSVRPSRSRTKSSGRNQDTPRGAIRSPCHQHHLLPSGSLHLLPTTPSLSLTRFKSSLHLGFQLPPLPRPSTSITNHKSLIHPHSLPHPLMQTRYLSTDPFRLRRVLQIEMSRHTLPPLPHQHMHSHDTPFQSLPASPDLTPIKTT